MKHRCTHSRSFCSCTAIPVRAKLIVAALAIAIPGFAAAASPTCVWVGTVMRTEIGEGMYDPTEYHWQDAAGWAADWLGVPGTCPGGTPDNAANTYNVVITDANAAPTPNNYGARSLVVTFRNGSSNPLASLTLSNSTIAFADPVTTGTLASTGSRLNGGTLVVNGSGGVNSLADTVNTGNMLSFTGAGSQTFVTHSLTFAVQVYRSRSGGIISVGSPGMLTVRNGAGLSFADVAIQAQDSTKSWQATIHADAGSNVGFLGSSTVSGGNLQGTFTMGAASTTAFSETNNQGVLVAGANSSLTFDNGKMTPSSGSVTGFVQSGNGVLKINDLNATGGTFDGLIHLTGDGPGGAVFDNKLNDVAVNPGATLSIESGNTSFGGANAGALNVAAGASVTVVAGTSNFGTLHNAANGTVTFSGDVANQVSGRIDNAGTMKVAAGATLSNRGTFNGLAQGTMSNAGTVDNSGTLNNAVGALFVNDSVVDNSGSVVAAGILKGAGSYRQSAGSTLVDGSLTQAAIDIEGGNLYGHGTVAGVLRNEGGVVQGGSSTAPGVLSVKGSFIQSSGGTLREMIGGTHGGQASELAITGDVTLDGVLQIVTASGFSFAAGQVFTIVSIDAGRLTGSFSKIVDGGLSSHDGSSLALGGDLELDVVYRVSDIELRVAAVPEPAGSALLFAGLGAIGLWTRRRASQT